MISCCRYLYNSVLRVHIWTLKVQMQHLNITLWMPMMKNSFIYFKRCQIINFNENGKTSPLQNVVHFDIFMWTDFSGIQIRTDRWILETINCYLVLHIKKSLRTMELILIYLHLHWHDKDHSVLDITIVWWQTACATLETFCQWNKGIRLWLAKAYLMSLGRISA